MTPLELERYRLSLMVASRWLLFRTYGDHSRALDAVRKIPIKRSKRRIAIMLYLTSGWTPWGVHLSQNEPPALSLCDKNSYIMCCGHVMGRKEAQLFRDHGLLRAGPPDRFKRETLIITEVGKAWLNVSW